ncbi:Protein CBG17940 [Caenorhabditis briggsae]|uniref:Protein CBG17940 n=1 Tax=Caenorhabditis briggsae TaxID=6238 RepID=A8XRY5_CAEBR|nr:Protein CBG17940 [Caenorhabditis briggsae]CAP35474.2 Protein CBG17940 [Caenorhabditis briggsae]
MFMFMLLMLLSSTSAHKGRPQRHTIVQPSELRPVEAIANLPELTSRNIADFIGNIDGTEESDEAALRFLATYGLVPNERECPECLNGKMSLVKDNALPLHFVWRCSSCKTSNIITKKMIRENTFFQEQKLSVQKIVHIAADWVESPGRNNERTASLHGVTTSTIVNLNKLFRQLTEQCSVPRPGTLVEDTVTTNDYYDFFLTTQVGQVGLARPTHYYVLLNDWDVPATFWPTVTHALTYLFCRTTSTVTLPAPVLYAHLAAKRAKETMDGALFANRGVGRVFDLSQFSELAQLTNCLQSNPSLDGMTFV